MKKVLVGCGVILALIVIAAVVAYFLIDPNYEVERSVTIAAGPDKIHPLVEDFHNWGEWSEWHATDPEMEVEYTGAEKGVDAGWSWTSAKHGNGSMVITSSDPQKGMWYDINIQGMGAKGTLLYDITETQTTITWIARGEMQGVWKLMTPLMDPMLGNEFMQPSLDRLKSVSETP